MTKRARRKPQPACPEIRVRLNAEFLVGRPDAAAVVTRLVDTLRQGLPYAVVDAVPPRRGGLLGYAACVLIGAGLAAAAGYALLPRDALFPAPGHAEAPAPPPASPALAQSYTLGIPLLPQEVPPDVQSQELARELAVCAGLSAALLAQRLGPVDLTAALGDASLALERSSVRQAGRAKVPDDAIDRWRAEGSEEAHGHLGRQDMRGALRRLAECRTAVGREIALPN